MRCRFWVEPFSVFGSATSGGQFWPPLFRTDALPLVKNKDFPTCRQPAFNLMSEAANIAARTQRFNETVRACTPPSRKTEPHRES